MERLKYIVNIIIIATLLAAIAIGRDGRIMGEDVTKLLESNSEEVAIETLLDDGTLVINSTALAGSIAGFAGTTPVKIYLKDGIITKVEPLANSETPSFFSEVVESGLFERWNGASISEAAVMDVDIVSGATYSSWAIIKNVQIASSYAADLEATSAGNPLSEAKDIAALIVILSAVVITFLRPKKIVYQRIQLLLNVAVVGLWCGSFLSLAQLVSWLSNGFNLTISLTSTLLLVVCVVMPLLGKKGSYCHIHCPMGSAQELLGSLPTAKLKLPQRVSSWLNKLRYYILISLLGMMWIGIGFEIMDYEVFSAFIIGSASNVVLVMAAIFLLLSLFIKRPYCRFICPTGALITISQKTKDI